MASRKFGAASKAVREYLSHNPEASPKEVASALVRYKVTPNLVSNIKSRTKRSLAASELIGEVGSQGEGGVAVGHHTKFAVQLLTAAKLLQECNGLKSARAMLELAAQILQHRLS